MYCLTLLFMYTKSLHPLITITLTGLKDTLIISKAVKCNLLTLSLVRTIIKYDYIYLIILAYLKAITFKVCGKY